MSVVAIIPARSGSKGIKDKNIYNLSGYPLIAYSIMAASLVPSIDRVIVSTDSNNYAALANKYGAETPFLRPSLISADNSQDIDFMLHAMNWFEEQENYTPEYWVHLRPTTPLRDPLLIESAVQEFKKNNKATSLRSAHLSPESPFKWFTKTKEHYFAGLDGSIEGLDYLNGPRQDFPDVYIPDGYVDIIKRSTVLDEKLIHGNKIMSFESPHCIEVDSPEELNMLEFQIENEGSVLLDNLNQINQ